MKKKIVLILSIAILTITLAGCGGETKEISETTISAVFENASDLTAQELIYTDVIELEKGNIPLLNKSNYLVKYTANVSAGFDISQAKIYLTDDTCTVTIPPSEMQDINIGSNNVKFYDTNFSIFKPDYNATMEALGLAEDHAKKYLQKSELLNLANDNAKSIVEGLVKGVVTDRDIVIKIAE